MSVSFEVTSGDLESLASGLSGLLGELEHAGDVRSVSAGPAENAQLESAIEGFIARWTQDLQSIQQSLASLSERLTGAGASYDRTERALTGGFSA